MKYCKNCGSENNDENQYCFNCRCDSFTPEKPETMNNNANNGGFRNVNPAAPAPNAPNASNAPRPPMQGVPPYPQPVVYPRPPKKPLTIPDMLSILGFVAAIVGMFSASVVLHPIAAICSFAGFIKATKFKPLAIAGFVISIVGGLVYIILSMYRSGLIPQWITFGAFH